jgi:superfamily II DNA/RNA helicase
LIQGNHVRLDDVATVVVDEADRMADMGFLPEVRRLLDQVRPDRQTLLFSATLDGDVDVLVKRYQRDPAVHSVVNDADAPVNRHIFWTVDRTERPAITADVVKAEWPAVVFCRTKHGADRLAKQLAKAGVAAAAIHGDRSQAQRERALAAFAKGKVQALVATDVAARGIHVDAVAAVVHFDLPASTKDYLHRSGRTGRAGSAGLVVSLVAREAKAEGKNLQHQLGYEPTNNPPDLTALAGEHHDARPATTVERRPAQAARPGRPRRRR